MAKKGMASGFKSGSLAKGGKKSAGKSGLLAPKFAISAKNLKGK